MSASVSTLSTSSTLSVYPTQMFKTTLPKGIKVQLTHVNLSSCHSLNSQLHYIIVGPALEGVVCVVFYVYMTFL